jgi:hypothetical protein
MTQLSEALYDEERTSSGSSPHAAAQGYSYNTFGGSGGSYQPVGMASQGAPVPNASSQQYYANAAAAAAAQIAAAAAVSNNSLGQLSQAQMSQAAASAHMAQHPAAPQYSYDGSATPQASNPFMNYSNYAQQYYGQNEYWSKEQNNEN